MLDFELLHWNMDHDVLGFLPTFFHEGDPRPAAEQINERYRHGGGWKPIPQFKMLDFIKGEIQYPGDAPMLPLARAFLHDERILFYQHAFVAITQPDGSFEIGRVD